MFRDRAQTRRSDEDLDRPLRLVSVPAAVALGLALLVIIAGGLWLFGGHVAVRVPASGVIVNPPNNVDVVATVAGVVAEGPSAIGSEVRRGEPVATVRTPAGDSVDIPATVSGTVVSIGTGTNDAVVDGEILVTIAPDTAPMIGVVFAPANTVPGITAGDPVTLHPISADPAATGSLTGTVSEVTPLPVGPDRIESLVTDPQLTELITAGGEPVHEILLTLTTDGDDLVWTGPGPAAPPTSGEIVAAQITIAEQTPWQALMGGGSG